MAKVKNLFSISRSECPCLSLQPFRNLLKLVINSHGSNPLGMAQLFGIRMQATVGGEYQG